ncbi:MAG: N-acetylglucosamine-6-phosphate deacetylase [Gemmataceae bacterium]
MRFQARHYATGEPLAIRIDAGRIVEVGPATGEVSSWVGPSYFDVQVNGSRGISFNAPTLSVDEVRRVADEVQSHSCGGFCPTLVTAGAEALTHGFATLARTCDSDADLARAMPGFHLEGPYIAAEDGPRGAHPKVHVRPPDRDEFRRWQDAAGGRIRLVTLAPEVPGGLSFIEWLTAQGVVVAIGHTAANGATIRDAAAAGARLSTHLGNGCHAVLPRHDNYIWEQLAHDALWASVIADGHHLPPSVLKCVLRVKSPKRTVLVSDAGSLAGLRPGRYDCWGQEFEVHPAGKIVVPGTGFLAGSAVFLNRCVAHAISGGFATPADAIGMAAERPRELLGLPVPRIAAGEIADIAVVRDDGTTISLGAN